MCGFLHLFHQEKVKELPTDSTLRCLWIHTRGCQSRKCDKTNTHQVHMSGSLREVGGKMEQGAREEKGRFKFTCHILSPQKKDDINMSKS